MRLTCPACRFPMVGTKATRRPSLRQRRTCSRTAATFVTMSMGAQSTRLRQLRLNSAITQRVVVKTPALHTLDRGEQLIVVSLVVDGVDGGGVDDEQRRRLVFMEEARVGLIEPLQIGTLDLLFVADAALGNALEQNIH